MLQNLKSNESLFYLHLYIDRVRETRLVPVSSSLTTIHTVRYTAHSLFTYEQWDHSGIQYTEWYLLFVLDFVLLGKLVLKVVPDQVRVPQAEILPLAAFRFTSQWTPSSSSANGSPYQVHGGLAPPSKSALPGTP